VVSTEHGAIMAAMILNSTRAVPMGVYVVRANAKLREELASNSKIARHLKTLERSVAALEAGGETSGTVQYIVRRYSSSSPSSIFRISPSSFGAPVV
jgi:hypothetical protein